MNRTSTLRPPRGFRRAALTSFLAACAATGVGTAPAQAQTLLHTVEAPNGELNGLFGDPIARVPDLDGDGLNDFIVGAIGATDGGTPLTYPGRAFVYSGASGAFLDSLASPNPDDSTAIFGRYVAGLDDVDGDGLGDLAVGAPYASPGTTPDFAGRAYIYSGADRALLHTLVSPHEQAGGEFGTGVSAVPDADGDGAGDVLIGGYGETVDGLAQAGRAYLFSGATGAVLHEIVSPNAEAFGLFGFYVAGVPDVDGDGRGDLLIGAYGESPGGTPAGSGQAYVFSGADGDLLYSLAPQFPRASGAFGFSVAGMQDVDGDGRGDLLVGGPDPDDADAPYAGSVSAYSGADGALLYVLTSPHEKVVGAFGASVSGVPDVDGDGTPDVLAGGPESLDPSLEFAGRVYAYSGADGSLLYELASPNEQLYGFFAIVAGLDDVDGDGRGDFLVGAGGESPDGSPFNFVGRAYVFSGAPGITAVEGEQPAAFVLGAPRPNPFSARATVAFTLAAPAHVRLALYDVLGREVAVLADGARPAGRHEAALDGAPLPSGAYLVRLDVLGTTGAHVETRPVTLLR